MDIYLYKERRNWKGESCNAEKLFDLDIKVYEKRELLDSFKYSFSIDSKDAVERYEECKEKFEEWLKESELEDSIKNSIKIAFFDKNILYASIGHPIRQLQN
jgi:hypothetical protein